MILSAEKMKSICGLSPNIGAKSDILDRCIEQSEDFDIKNALGNAFYSIIDANKSDYKLFVDGGVYEIDNVKYTFKGLNYAIAYYALARWTKVSNRQPTPFGTVVKSTNDSDPIQQDEIKILVDDYKAIADRYMAECVSFVQGQSDVKYKLLANVDQEIREFHKRIKIDVIG